MGPGCQDKLDLLWDHAYSYSPCEREATFLDTYKYQTLYIIRNHLHLDLKSEYVMEEESHSLWVALKGRYEQQKTILLLEANHEWTQIRL
jgi:hypothetical protein